MKDSIITTNVAKETININDWNTSMGITSFRRECRPPCTPSAAGLL
ncbi:hypothetical protein LPY66_17065 [Dehalobacter sp. DCM]|nr:hypothetical protein LPY66_17065 [Dehalobacter sp. DCM]